MTGVSASGPGSNVPVKGFGGVIVNCLASNSPGGSTLQFQVCGDNAASGSYASRWLPVFAQNLETGAWGTAFGVSTMASGALFSVVTFGADLFRPFLTTSMAGTIDVEVRQLGGVMFSNNGVTRAS